MLELFRKLPIDQILRSSHQARKDFDHEGLISLSESLRQEGLQNPITIRLIACFDANCRAPRLDPMEEFPPCPEGSHWHGELVAGERRLRAAGILGWPVIDAKVIQTVSEAESAAKGLIENLQRKNLTPLEETEGFQDLLDLKDEYWNQRKIALAVGKTEGYISQSVRFLSFSRDVLESFRALKFSRSHALELLRLPDAAKQSEVAKIIVAKKLSWEVTRKLVDKMVKPGKVPRKKVQPANVVVMAAVWPSLIANTKIDACGYWGVEFKGANWNFTASSEKFATNEDFATWFRQLADAIAPQAKGHAPAVAAANLSAPTATGGAPIMSPAPLSDEEEQIQAAIEDAKKMPKIGRLVP